MYAIARGHQSTTTKGKKKNLATRPKGNQKMMLTLSRTFQASTIMLLVAIKPLTHQT